jgi:hypothetical protein
MGLALAASLISIRIGIAVALVEIFMGVIGGNPRRRSCRVRGCRGGRGDRRGPGAEALIGR